MLRVEAVVVVRYTIGECSEIVAHLASRTGMLSMIWCIHRAYLFVCARIFNAEFDDDHISRQDVIDWKISKIFRR